MLNYEEIIEALEEVKDPEIPVLSLNDLGVIKGIAITENKITVTITPTFVGCPALEIMKQEVKSVLEKKAGVTVDVTVSFENPWSSNDISPRGREALKSFGLAAPPDSRLFHDLDILDQVPCPNCESTNTELRSPFGPTLCRSIHYCHHCRETFEQFKPL